MAEEAGADYVGFILVPGTPRYVTPEEARELRLGVRVPSVIVLADRGINEAVRSAETVGASVIQLHGSESPGFLADLRASGPWEVWKAVRVRGAGDARDGLSRFGEVADGLLLDGWHPDKIGGTGELFSWRDVGKIRNEIPLRLRFIVAGGMDPTNVGEAVARLRPDLVDVSSGVEASPGVKDRSRVETFINRAKTARKGDAG
jgi:phosphoribosylanthranilate isomerase